jgi:hypothetical protein
MSFGRLGAGGGGVRAISAVWALLKQLFDGGAVQGDSLYFTGDTGSAVQGDE